MFSALTLGCELDNPEGAPGVDAAVDLAGDAAIDTPTDVSSDTVDDTNDDVVDDIPGDLDAADVAADTMDVTDSAMDADVMVEPCPEPPVGDPPTLGRWSLSLFHFNIQYVAGGTIGLAEIGFLTPSLAETLDYTEVEVEDAILVESFFPLFDVLEAVPEAAITVEMQGFMIDVIADRFPNELDRMRNLIDAGQLEVASIHWSDQFFLAFGPQDMDESWARTQQSFAAANIPLSNVVFTQEGQFGEGFASWLNATRPDAVMVMARNLQRFHQNTLDNEPMWLVSDLEVVIPRSVNSDLVEMQWNFFDDGELLATGDVNPYLGDQFRRQDRSVNEYIRELECLVERGYEVGLVSDYVSALRDDGYSPNQLPPFLDGTWQPGSTRGPLRWMGGAGQVWARHERDHDVLSACVDARDHVLALQTLLEDLGAGAIEADRNDLDVAWRELLWGEVSDARGVNPWWGEIEYGLLHCGNARQTAEARIGAIATRRGANYLQIDTASGLVTELDNPPTPPMLAAVTAPIEIVVAEDASRPVEIRWLRDEDTPDSPYRVEVTWDVVPGADEAYNACRNGGNEEWACSEEPEPLVLHWPRTPGLISYRPALQDSIVTYMESDFTFQSDAFTDAAWTTSADGLVGLGEGRYLVKDTNTAHFAIGFPAGEGRNAVVDIRDETLQPWKTATWVFWYTESEQTARDLANANITPTVVVAAD